jgi:hypothetical protein
MEISTARALLAVTMLISMVSLLLINSPAPRIANASLAQDPNANLPPNITKSSGRSSAGSTAREKARAERARRKREQAAAEAAAAQERAEREKREEEQVWMVALLENHTDSPIVYHCSCMSEERTIGPGERRLYTTRDKAVTIRFQSGSEEKQYSLQATQVVGHHPTESDERQAKVNYFEVDANGNLHLYAKP